MEKRQKIGDELLSALKIKLNDSNQMLAINNQKNTKQKLIL